MLGDPQLAPYFDGTRHGAPAAHRLRAFIAAALGGTQAPPLGLGITERDFDRVAGHLAGALRTLGVPTEQVQAILARIAPLPRRPRPDPPGFPAVLITVEGIDGAGKSTLVAGLAEALREHDPVVLREPGGVELAERLRALVKDPALTVGARAEALVYAAARAQLVEERLRPLLDAGRLVLLDRFVDSSLAYQGAGRGLGVAAVRELNAFGTGGLVPDRTLLLRIDPAAGLARVGGRGDGAGPHRARARGVLDRMRERLRRAGGRRAGALGS